MMRKQLLTTLVLLTAIPALADNYFTIGENDTLLMDPIRDVIEYRTIHVRAHFDGRLDYWKIDFSVPINFEYVAMDPRSGMTVPYVNIFGDSTAYNALLTHNTIDGLSASSYIPILGYWDYNEDGVYESYGTVKWEAGDYYSMFAITFRVPFGFTGGVITLSGNLNSGPDDRGGTIQNFPPVTFSRTITVKVGYCRGDVTGDGRVSMDDLSALSAYLLTQTGLDQCQLEAADMNGDGTVNMDDLGLLITYLLTNTGLSQDELEQILNGGTQTS